MNVLKEPSEFSLSSMIADFEISSSVDVLFEIRLSGKTILKEQYSPDSSNRIYVRGRALGKTLQKYLYGNNLTTGVQANISNQFSVYIDNSLHATYSVLRSNLYTDLPAANFFDGSVFLNLSEKIKWTTPGAKEYLTCFSPSPATTPVQANVIYRVGDTFQSSGLKNYNVPVSGKFQTFDVSFSVIASRFTEVNRNTIVAYKVHAKNQVCTYYVDRESYILPLQFIYKNAFDVPSSIYTRGIATRKGATTFDTSKINAVARKSNIHRTDTFTVSSGRIYTADDYDYYRDLFNSPDVRILFKDKYRKIIITEENSTEPLRKGSLPAVSFSFQFADEYENNILLGKAFYAWILEQGIWNDNNMWLDNGLWLDEPPESTDAMRILESLT